MGHLEIAYDLLVIMIGLAALSIVVFWAARMGESDLPPRYIVKIKKPDISTAICQSI